MEKHSLSSIKEMHQYEGKTATLQGWVHNIRSSKALVFIILRDGSGLCQCVVSKEDVSGQTWEQANTLTQESSLSIKGAVKKDERSVGGYELHVSELEPIQLAKDYPITPKEHGVEFLMENRHLWLRSQRQWAAMRVRNQIIFAIHQFFQQRGFVQMDAPIFTGNAAEGTTTLFETDYFDEKAYLSQSGQLYGEAMAMANGKIYTFGPTFRAEKSKTRRHLTEFWMIEPEMAFYDHDMNMDLAEDMVCAIVENVLQHCRTELETLGRDLTMLEKVKKPFPRITYTEAVELLTSEKNAALLDDMERGNMEELQAIDKEIPELEAEHGQAKKGRKFKIDKRLRELRARKEEVEENLRNIPVWRKSAMEKQWGDDFGGSDETLLTMHYDRPVMVHGYPAAIKAFYMKRDPENEHVALGVDVLAPEGYGEMIGGAQREDSLELLQQRIKEHGLDEETFKWYLDLRRFGSVPHSGFGLGLERTVAWLCGLNHVRETIPFPRMMGRLTP
ncbi:MAG: asparagine--tRNA ligase [Cyclonatronaceae bacterium]